MEGRIIKLHEPRILKIAVIIVIGLIIVTTFSAAAVDDGGWNPVENDRDGDGLTLEEEKARTKIYDEIYFTDMVSSTSPVPPDEPVLSVEDFNSGSVTISWNQVGNVMNYEIYRKETNMDREREDVINKQFNVYTVDTINPYSMELRVENILDGGDAKGRVHMEFFDASGIAYVNITNLNQGNYKNISASELEYYDGLIILDKYIDIEGDSDYWVDGWDLGVLIVDKNGSEFYEEKHVQSELGGIWQEFTEWIREHVWGTVEEAVEKAKELGDALKDWVIDTATQAFEAAIWATQAKEENPVFAEGLSVFSMILAVAGLGMIFRDLAGIGSAGGSDACAAVVTLATLLSFSPIITSATTWFIVVKSQQEG